VIFLDLDSENGRRDGVPHFRARRSPREVVDGPFVSSPDAVLEREELGGRATRKRLDLIRSSYLKSATPGLENLLVKVTSLFGGRGCKDK
jgi:hypothetical protein